MLLDEARIDYKHQHPWESYAASIESEWLQCQDEGLDVGAYAELFQAISKLEPGPIKDRLCDTLYTALSACRHQTRLALSRAERFGGYSA